MRVPVRAGHYAQKGSERVPFQREQVSKPEASFFAMSAQMSVNFLVDCKLCPFVVWFEFLIRFEFYRPFPVLSTSVRRYTE